MTNDIKVELITDYLQQNKLTKTAFCKQCKISLGTLNKILKNQKNVFITSIVKIARKINTELKDMFEK